jgi:hypothetical protein
MAGAHAQSAQLSTSADSGSRHCPGHAQPRSGGGPSVPSSHSCCDEARCDCGVASACLAFVAAPLGSQFAQAPLNAAQAVSAIPQGLRSPLFRPPIK